MSRGATDTRARILKETIRLMEERRGRDVTMKDIADAVGVSRQYIYQHFPSRGVLMISAAHYLDEVKGLEARVQRYRAAAGGIEALEAYVDFWGNYIPDIYGLASALLEARDTDPAAAAAWDDRMAAVRRGCRRVVTALARDGLLSMGVEEAVDLMWSLLSIRVWELLVLESGWPVSRYVSHMKTVLTRTLVREK